MSFYDNASLVVIPSGYKTSKVYSVKPTDGSGDLTFSRSNNTATRVNSAGLIEKVRTNVVLRSEEQSNAQYAVVINEIASRVAVANPLTGQNNAYKITSTANNDPYIGQVVTGLSNGENTFSLWLWTDSGQALNCDLFFYNASASEVYVKSITISTTPTRYTHTVNFTSIGANATIRLDLRQTGPTVQYVYTYGWQAESGVATAYIATTSAAVSVGPVANVPRLDYLNSSCPRLLLEPQRTNLATYSEQFNNAAWLNGQNVGAATITANQIISPDGYVDADRIAFPAVGAGGQYNVLFQPFTASATAYTASVYLRGQNGGEVVWISFTKDGVNYNRTQCTLTTAWQRFTLTATLTAGSDNFQIGVDTRDSSQSARSAQTIYAWGAQLEAGAYATSYISTQNSSVTRGADAASKTGISSLIGQTEGTLFAEVSTQQAGSTASWFNISDGSSVNWVFIGKDVNKMRGFIRFNGTTIFSNESFTITDNASMKVAIAYKSGDYAMYVNGSLIASGTSSFSVSASISRMDLGVLTSAVDEVAKYNQALLFKTRLTNAQLAELTTL